MRCASWCPLLAAVLVFGCASEQHVPDLLEVADVSPRVADVGDRIEVVGSGFPSGRAATVTFRGTLHRPGAPDSPIHTVVRASQVTPYRIALDWNDELRAEFCGDGDDAVHTTFRGDVVAAFAPQRSGAPPVRGTVSNVELDVVPPAVSAPTAAQRTTEAERVLAFLGMAVDGSGRALRVSEVDPAGRAARAGLEVEDRIENFAGVRVQDEKDLIPAVGHRWAEVVVRRGRIPEPLVRVVSVDGFHPVAPSDVAPAGALIGLAAALLVLWATPLGRTSTWLARRVAGTLGADSESPPRLWEAISSLLDTADEPALARLLRHLGVLGVSALLTVLSFDVSWISPELDLGLALLVSGTAMTTAGLVAGGWQDSRRWSFFRGARAAFTVFSSQLPFLLVAIACVVAAGSIRLSEVVDAQGFWPWQWVAFQSPVGPVALAVVLAALVPSLESGPSSGGGHGRKSPRRSALLGALGHSMHTLLLSGLAATLLLGGWSLGDFPDHLGTRALGTAVLHFKCWTLMLLVALLRRSLPRLEPGQILGVCWRWLTPVAALVLLGLAAWTWGLRFPALRSLAPGVSAGVFLLTCLVGVGFGWRVVRVFRDGKPRMAVNPWI